MADRRIVVASSHPCEIIDSEDQPPKPPGSGAQSFSSKLRAPPRTQPVMSDASRRMATNPTWQRAEIAGRKAPPACAFGVQEAFSAPTPVTSLSNKAHGAAASHDSHETSEGQATSRDSWWQSALNAVGQWAKTTALQVLDDEPEQETPPEEKQHEEVDDLVNYCFYLGADVNDHPEIIPLVANMFWQPLPEDWKGFATSKDSEHGEGFTYYWNSKTGRTQWVHPNEEEHVRILEKKVRKVIPGTRIWFRRNDEIRNSQVYTIFREQTKHLPECRPLLRSADSPSVLKKGVIDCMVKDQHFPLLHPGVFSAFVSYFQIEKYEDVHMWGGFLIKLSAVCPVPPGWTFKYDESMCEAVYVRGDYFCTKRHPMDGFFSVMLDLLFQRHYLWRMKGGDRRLSEYFNANAQAPVDVPSVASAPTQFATAQKHDFIPLAPVTPKAPLPPTCDRPSAIQIPSPLQAKARVLACHFLDKRTEIEVDAEQSHAGYEPNRAQQDLALLRGNAPKSSEPAATPISRSKRGAPPTFPAAPPVFSVAQATFTSKMQPPPPPLRTYSATASGHGGRGDNAARPSAQSAARDNLATADSYKSQPKENSGPGAPRQQITPRSPPLSGDGQLYPGAPSELPISPAARNLGYRGQRQSEFDCAVAAGATELYSLPHESDDTPRPPSHSPISAGAPLGPPSPLADQHACDTLPVIPDAQGDPFAIDSARSDRTETSLRNPGGRSQEEHPFARPPRIKWDMTSPTAPVAPGEAAVREADATQSEGSERRGPQGPAAKTSAIESEIAMGNAATRQYTAAATPGQFQHADVPHVSPEVPNARDSGAPGAAPGSSALLALSGTSLATRDTEEPTGSAYPDLPSGSRAEYASYLPHANPVAASVTADARAVALGESAGREFTAASQPPGVACPRDIPTSLPAPTRGHAIATSSDSSVLDIAVCPGSGAQPPPPNAPSIDAGNLSQRLMTEALESEPRAPAPARPTILGRSSEKGADSLPLAANAPAARRAPPPPPPQPPQQHPVALRKTDGRCDEAFSPPVAEKIAPATTPAGETPHQSAPGSPGPDAALRTVLALTAKLQTAADDEILNILESLGEVRMTVHILQESKVGVATQRFKAHHNTAVQECVMQLRQQWKGVILQKNKREGVHHMAPCGSGPIMTPVDAGEPKCVSEIPRQILWEGTHRASRVNSQAIQWLCRLFLEQREALYEILVDRAGEDEADRIRGHLDVVRFRALVTDAFEGMEHKPLQNFMRRFAGTTLTATFCSTTTGEKWWEFIVKAIDSKGTTSEDWARKDLPRLLADIGVCVEEIRKEPIATSPFTLGQTSPKRLSGMSSLRSSPSSSIAPSVISPLAHSSPKVQPSSFTPAEKLSAPPADDDSQKSSSKYPPPQLSPILSSDEDSDASLTTLARFIGVNRPGETSTRETQENTTRETVTALNPELRGKLSAYASEAFPTLGSAMDCYLPGASICTNGVLEQLTDGELTICDHLMEMLTLETNRRLLEAFQTRDELKLDIQHRHEYSNMLYARAHKTAFSTDLF